MFSRSVAECSEFGKDDTIRMKNRGTVKQHNTFLAVLKRAILAVLGWVAFSFFLIWHLLILDGKISGFLELSLILSMLGVAIVFDVFYLFSVSLLLSVISIAFTHLLNKIIMYSLVIMGISIVPESAAMVLNTASVIVPFFLFYMSFERFLVNSENVLIGYSIFHFFMLAFVQKNQLGEAFSPYTIDNPIQWVVLVIVLLMSLYYKLKLI